MAAGPLSKRRSRRALAAITDVPVWFHSLELAPGVVTPGTKSREALEVELAKLNLPDLRGRTVLDIGAWDGYFSFAAERLGAKRVVALDHYAWSMDHEAQRRYWDLCHRQGRTPDPPETVDEIWRPHELPGKQGFDLARGLLKSRVEAVVGDFMTMDLDALGQFDVVLFLGVLYHLRHPLVALERLRRVTGEVAVIETTCTVLPEHENRALWEFFPSDELDGDPSNWWAPNAEGLAAMCRTAGFGEVQYMARPGTDAALADGSDRYYGRAVIHARVS